MSAQAQLCNTRLTMRATQRPSARPIAPLPAARRRRRAAAGRQQARALFGFGKQEPSGAAAATAAPVLDETGAMLTPFTPIQKTPDYSLRLYGAYPVAECVYERRDEGFFLLGSYMSGNNAAEARCRETQPVVMRYDPQGSKRMQVHVVLKSSGSDGDSDASGPPSPAGLPPAPNDSGVRLGVAGGEVIAARQFEGNATQEACEKCRQALLEALQRDGLTLADAEAAGSFRLAQYGPIHSLQTRTNEIWVAVKL